MKQLIFKESVAYKGGIQYIYILANHFELEEDSITLLKEHGDVGQSLFVSSLRGLIQTMIKKKDLIFLSYISKSGFRASLP
jgi:hypothetical protein